MVDSISGLGSMSGMMSSMQSATLTDDQKSTISDILSQYDPDNITADDAKSIFEQFRDAGIRPSKGMKEAITDAGFDADELRSLGMPDQPPQGAGGPPPSSSSSSSSSGVNVSALQSLQSILDQYDLSSLSSDQETNLISQLTNAGLMQSGNMIDISA